MYLVFRAEENDVAFPQESETNTAYDLMWVTYKWHLLRMKEQSPCVRKGETASIEFGGQWIY